MKLILIADTHNQHRDLEVPDGDILIHAGDITYGFKSGMHYEQYEDFNEWLKSLPHKHKIVIPGNHDRLAESRPDLVRAAMKDCHFLIDETITISGLKIHGSPWTPWFYDWAFNTRGNQMAEITAAMPKCDVLVTHGPPFGVLDYVPRGGCVGAPELRKEIFNRIRPKLHVFGHIHCGAGKKVTDDITFINAAMVDETYQIVNNPWEVELEYAMYEDFK